MEEERERQAGEVALRLRQALEAERQRADVLAGELAAARQAIAVTTGPADPPGMHTTRVETEATPAQATSNDTGILDRPASLEAELSVAAGKLLTQLLARADLFLRQGDIGAARVVLERALEMGSAEAGYRLAETYDPRVLSAWRTFGTRGDPAKARELYARAYADGIRQAKDRMNALR
jgi:TPR repeat protein